MKKLLPTLAGFALAASNFSLAAAAQNADTNQFKVAAVQLRSARDLTEMVARINRSLRQCAAQGAQVAVFPECASSGYFEDFATNLTAAQIGGAEDQVADACRAARVYAFFGSPHRDANQLWNSATVFSPEGRILERYHKLLPAEAWPRPGDHLSVFKVDEVPCTIIICHDERYPEPVRLPELAGAKVIFHTSHESGLHKETKIQPFRAQTQTRAAEKNVFIVHASAPANPDATGSHGQSRIIAPNGNVLNATSIFDGEELVATLDLAKVTRQNARRSLTDDPLQDWWKEGLKHVRIVE